jgi:hypothetical protein
MQITAIVDEITVERQGGNAGVRSSNPCVGYGSTTQVTGTARRAIAASPVTVLAACVTGVVGTRQIKSAGLTIK